MYKRLYLLNSVAIICVVIAHANSFARHVMTSRVFIDRIQGFPGHDQLGGLALITITALKPLWTFSVPAFFFVSGYFIAFGNRGLNSHLTIRSIKLRITNLLIPFIIWFGVFFLADFLLFIGKIYILVSLPREPLFQYFKSFISFYTPQYHLFFVPLLCLFFLIAPWLAPLVKKHCKLVLISAATFHVVLYILLWLEMNNLFIVRVPLLGTISQWYPSQWTPGWLFFGSLGISFGYDPDRWKPWLERYRGIIFLLAVIFIVIEIVAVVTYKSNTIPIEERPRLFTELLYALFFILSFLQIPIEKFKISKQLLSLNSKVYGIYLIHLTILEFVCRGLGYFFPVLVAYQIILQPVLIAVGLGVPILFMDAVARSPMRKYYRYLFG
jgi:hypothetical protein